MADDKSIPSDRLMDILSILGTGGVAGTLVGPQALRRMGNAKSMHPAAASFMGWRNNSLTHPDAVAEQRNIDEYIRNNYRSLNTDKPSASDIDRMHNMGWQHSPVTGLSREVTDPRLNVSEAGQYSHPEGDILGAHGIKPKVQWGSRVMEREDEPRGMRWEQYDPVTWGDYFNKNMSLESILKNPGQVRNLDQSFDRFYRPGEYRSPLSHINYRDIWDQNKSLIPGAAAAQTQLGIQHASPQAWGREQQYFPIEAKAVGRRALYPDQYQVPFREHFDAIKNVLRDD